MTEDNKKLLVNLGIVFTACLITYKIPYDSYTVIEFIIRPIQINGGTLMLAGFVPLALYIIGILGLFRLERFANTSKILIFLAVIIIVVPTMKWTLDTARTSYHWISGDELKALDIADANMNLSVSAIEHDVDKITINTSYEVVNYGRGPKRFNVRLYLPESLSEAFGKEFVELDKNYMIYGARNSLRIEEEINIEQAGAALDDHTYSKRWYRETYEYELYNEIESVRFKIRGR